MNQKRAQTAATGSRPKKDFLGVPDNTISPFRPPNEEEVFISREAEKQKKKEAKEANKRLKIWDKKTATSRMPLKRVRDKDVEPLQTDETFYNFNKEKRATISRAIQSAKSRVQHPTESRPQNINEFIDQKKEMFLVELSNNTIQKEIYNLEEKNERKSHALQDSSSALEQDNAKLIEFIEEDNMTRQRKMEAAEDAKQRKNSADKRIRELEQQIQSQKSEIDKNMELVKQFENHKEFLFKIFEQEDKVWADKQERQKNYKIEKIKAKFMDEVIMNPDKYEDEEKLLSDAPKNKPDGQSSLGGSFNQQTTKFGRQGINRDVRDEKSLESKFHILLENDDIDVDEEFYDEEILFKDPQQLMTLFEKLQETNLDRIEKRQFNEHQKELRDQEYERTTHHFDNLVNTQKDYNEEITESIQIATTVLNELKKQNKMNEQQGSGQQKKSSAKADKNKDEEYEVDIDFIMTDLRKEISKIYTTCCDDRNKLEALRGKRDIDILQEIEKTFLEQMKQIKYIHDYGQGKFADKVIQQTKRRSDFWFEKRQRDISAQRQKEKEALQQKMKDKQTKFKKMVGRPVTSRSTKPKLKKKEKKIEIDEDTQDQLDYLGFELKAIPDDNVVSEEEEAQ